MRCAVNGRPVLMWSPTWRPVVRAAGFDVDVDMDIGRMMVDRLEEAFLYPSMAPDSSALRWIVRFLIYSCGWASSSGNVTVRHDTLMSTLCDWRVWRTLAESATLFVLRWAVGQALHHFVESQLWLIDGVFERLLLAIGDDYSVTRLAAQLVAALKPFAG